MKFEGYLTFDETIAPQEFVAWMLTTMSQILPHAQTRPWEPNSVIVDNGHDHQEFVPASPVEFADVFAAHVTYAHRPQHSMYIIYFYPDTTTMNLILYYLAKRWSYVWSFFDVFSSSVELQQTIEVNLAKQQANASESE